MHYSEFPNAPVVGTVLCALSDITAGRYFSADLSGFPVLVVAGPTAFVNACPHQFLPLDHRGTVLGADGAIHCSNHHASFDVETGVGLGGHGLGCALTKIPTRVKGDNLVVA